MLENFVVSKILCTFAPSNSNNKKVMTKDFILSKMRMAVKSNGVNGYYIYFEDAVELTDGTLINEVRLSRRGVEFLEKNTNRVISKLRKKDLLLIYNRI